MMWKSLYYHQVPVSSDVRSSRGQFTSLLPAAQGGCCPLTSPSSATQQLPSASEMLLTLREWWGMLLPSCCIPTESPRAAAVGVWISAGWRDTTCSVPKVWQHLTCLQNKPSLFLYPCSKRVSMKPCSEKKYKAEEPRKPFGDCRHLQDMHQFASPPHPANTEAAPVGCAASPHPWGAQVSQDILSTAQGQPSTLCVQHSSITLNKLCPSSVPQLLPPSSATPQITPATIWKCLGWNVVSFMQ